jgi:YfiH family protein
VFFRDDREVYRAGGLAGFSWLEHGFGTRNSAQWPDPWRLVMLKQIHSDSVVRIDGGRGYAGEGDALITDRPGVLVGIRTADCVPILLADPGKQVVAAVHAGWRGSAARIVEKTVAALAREYGSDPAGLHAAIGPAIGLCCYEVGNEVAGSFPDHATPGANGRSHLDLTAVNRSQLVAAGLRPEQIYGGAGCTKCNDEFHSYRREGARAGRLISAIGIL